MSEQQTLIDETLRERWAIQMVMGKGTEPIHIVSSSITNPASWDAGSMCFDIPAGHVVCGIVLEATKAPNTQGRRMVITRIDYCREPGT
jgi:hypothetical protein